MPHDIDLKKFLHGDFAPIDKLLMILAVQDRPISISNLTADAAQAGFRIPKKWNLSAVLSRSKGKAIRLPAGWEITPLGAEHLAQIGVATRSPIAVQAENDLRTHLAKIKSDTTRAFVEEAIRCLEYNLLRSAIVMSWIAAVDVLYTEVVDHHLAKFNAEASRVNPKWKAAQSADGLSIMGEKDFLDRLVTIGVLGKNQKQELEKALTLRNGCGHPNSLKIGQKSVAAHLEILLLNVFDKYSG
ncbi:hypothetical protein [Hoeflea sp.]|uniref:hypothetical protein n=1 Tax=Hoeflea sp. TaxID=1940281 RepID=UPI003A91E0D2